MTLTDLLNLSKKRQYTSEEDYKQDVLKAVELLRELGVGNDPSQDLKTSVESIVKALEDKEIELDGRKLSKDEITEELEAVKADIESIEQLQKFKADIAAIEELKRVNQEIAELEKEEAEIERKIAYIKARQAI